MGGRLLEWAMASRAVVLLLVASLAWCGGYAFLHVNVEAYPDPAPAIVEVVAQYPGASAEEVERLVTIPLEVALANMPGLKYTRSKSMFGLAHLRNQFNYGIDYIAARQEVINRLATAELPKTVKPIVSPASPIGEIYRYTLHSPKDALGHDIYTRNDLKSLQDWTLQRQFLRIPGVAGVVGSGGTVKRYEIQPDPQRLKEYGVTLQQLEDAVSSSNANAGGNFIVQGASVQVVRGIGLIGGGEDPIVKAMNMADAPTAAAYLRAEERRRVRQIRQIVIASTNNVPIRVEHVVKGGPVRPEEDDLSEGVIVGFQTRQGQIGIIHPLIDRDGNEMVDQHNQRVMLDEDDKVQGIILLRKGEKSLPVLDDVHEKVKTLNHEAGRLLPGVYLEPYYNRSSLIDVTTETVRENLLVGVVLVTLILLMFLSNVRTALIVAISIPLALPLAFSMLYVRGKSANLLSIGAVDFGIIVDSSVIMVENIYRRLTSGEAVELHVKDRVLRAAKEVERSLFYSTLIMVCALLPLFTMHGPEGQIFGPMADTYAFALGGALLLAFTISPVLCAILFGNLRPAGDNFIVRAIKQAYMGQLRLFLNNRWVTVGAFLVLAFSTAAVVPFMGREFMPELEEGNLVVRGTFPINVSLEKVARNARYVRKRLAEYPEIKLASSQIGRPDDGTDPTGYYELQLFVPLNPRSKWPAPSGKKTPREKFELVEDLDDDLSRHVPGVNWDFSQIIRDNVMESLSGVKGENSVKIVGPDLDELERLAIDFRNTLSQVPGVSDPGIFRIKGQTNLSFPIDRAKCAMWGVSVADVEDVISTAVGGMPFTQMLEGERRFDIALRWPEDLRKSADDILDIPVDVVKNTVTEGTVSGRPATPFTGASTGLSALGTSLPMPALAGSTSFAAATNLSRVPHRRLGDLVNPHEEDAVDNNDSFVKPGAATISREQGERLIAVKFGVRGRDLASTVKESQTRTNPLLKTPYRSTWSGEFQQMQEAELRILLVASLALLLIIIMLYLAFYSLLDAVLVLANVVAMSLGGLWTLLLAGLHFNVSAAVGFISILGVAVMEGMILVSSFNSLRAVRVPVFEAILKGAERRIRPVTMTALTAILGLLPAAFSTKIGSESQRPLAIVVVGGMIGTLLFFNLVPVLYSFYGHREPHAGAGHMAH